MHHVVSPCLRRLFHALPIGGLVLLLSCKSEPPVFNPSGEYEYQFHSFPMDFVTSGSSQVGANIGYSSRLYTGIINTNDTVYTLLRLLPDIIRDHDVCDADSKDKVSISLQTLKSIATLDGDSFTPLFDTLSLNISRIILPPEWSEEANIDSGSAVMILNQNTEDILDFNYTEKTLIIEFSTDSLTISQWCENNTDTLGVLIKYLPDPNDVLPFIEFYSSDTVEYKQPKLNFSYQTSGDTSYVENRYAIDPVLIGVDSANLNSVYMIIDPDSANWGRVYAFNFPEPPVLSNFIETIQDLQAPLDDIISGTQTDSVLELIEINITRNDSDFETIESITFWLNNVVAFKSATDPAGDDSTDGNQEFDWEDRNNDDIINSIDFAELYEDYGTDGCEDLLEDAIGGCVDASDDSPYNLEGTEGNGGTPDWTDNDGDGIWDTGDSGERWWDWGFDWCPDSLEDGTGPCLADTVANGPEPCNCLETLNAAYDPADLAYNPTIDPNGDNYDPSRDDWHDDDDDGDWDDGEGTEGNHQWDQGEPFHDWGSDGAPASFAGYFDEDNSEGNGTYEVGETFYDTGSDGKYNFDEVENYYLNNRTEGNFIFDEDPGERFLDCGEDEDYDLLMPHPVTGDWGCTVDVGGEEDDYNGDPNQDNWHDGVGTENNDLLDWTDCSMSDFNICEGHADWEEGFGNGVWDEGEGEQWWDWGYDHYPDAQEEFFYPFPQILINNNNELHVWPDDDSKFDILIGEDHPLQDHPQPNAGSSIAEIWISDIEKINIVDDSVTWKIVISVNTPVALTGIQFELMHTPFTWHDTIPLSYQVSESQIGINKLYQDITLFPNVGIPNNDILDSNLMVNFSNGMVAMLDFTGLKDTLDRWEDIIFSYLYSNLVLYIDTTIGLHEDMNLIMKNQAGNTVEIIKDNILIETGMTSLVIPMGTVMQHYEYGTYGDYMGIYLESEGTSYNYDQIHFTVNDTVYPRLDLTYRR